MIKVVLSSEKISIWALSYLQDFWFQISFDESHRQPFWTSTVRNVVYFSSKPLVKMLFKSFIMSLISYCLPFIFTCIYASDKKAIRKIFWDCFKLVIEYHGIDLHIQKLTKTFAIKYIEDDDHFINEFLSQCPSGRYRTVKYRGAWGRDSFYATL